MLSNVRPDLRLPSGRPTGLVLDIRITVHVDSMGRPNMETLDMSGQGASDNRDIVAEWVRSSRFRPAQRAGQPVEGVFQTRIQARSEVRRMGATGASTRMTAIAPSLLVTASHSAATKAG